MESFTEKEKAVLSRFCTSTESDCFVLINLPEVVKGALFSRYSRSPKSLRRLLLDEFILNPESGFADMVGGEPSGQSLAAATQKAEEFYERVLVGYGDDSVAELGGAHLACENISNLLTKLMQDSRIGISPLEKSTRYVYFDQKDEKGQYRYLREQKIMQSRFSDEYLRVCDFLFETYSSLIPQVAKMQQEKFPRPDGLSERAYLATIRAKVCDILRGILPASTLTNAGFFGNGRAFEYLLAKLYASPLSEAQSLARLAQQELSKTIPSFVKRADDRYGRQLQQYIRENREAVSRLAAKYGKLQEAKEEPPSVVLVDYDSEAEEKILAAILFANSHASMEEAKKQAAALLPQERQQLLSAYIGNRQNRRQKPGRAFEMPYYTFCITANFGIYRDLHRHRILTQERQLLTTRHGFDMPKELVEAGLDGKVREAVAAADELFGRLSASMPYEAQYVVPLGCRMRWYVRMNLRQCYHFCELRSMRQGHPDYRKVAQEIHRRISSVHPSLAAGMKFVDYESYELERLEAEKKTDRKLEEMERKKG
ncbi:MAG: FAD-dependent thymidylate synthase [Candidatus Micrarchaeota archaeon]|nr:FAD-dependent thymidylate synthase [Candidatus Micrarchaeota archaeon]